MLALETNCVPEVPPHSPEIERSILGSCLVSPKALAEAIRTIRPEYFFSSVHQQLYAIMQSMAITGCEIDIVTVSERFPDNELLLSELCEDVSTTENLKSHTNILLEKFRLRQLQEKAIRLQQAIAFGEPERIDEIQKEISEIHHQEGDFSENIFIPSWSNEPAKIEPLIELNGVKILSKGNVSMITAGAGHGKTSVLEAGCASLIVNSADTLGLKFHADSCLDIDTERSHEDHHTSWKRFMQRCGLNKGDTSPEAVQWLNIRGIDSLQDRLSYLWTVIDTDNAPDIVLIDGIGDFVADPNDSTECTKLVSRLSSIVHNREIGIVVTLHSNPQINNQKARGVLGSELWRKCQCVMIIEKMDDSVRRLTTDYSLGKNRTGSDVLSSYFCWDTELKMHVSCEAPATKSSGKTTMLRDNVIGAMGSRVLSYSDLKTLIMNTSGKSEPTAKRMIGELSSIGKIVKSNDNTYSVVNNSKMDWIHE